MAVMSKKCVLNLALSWGGESLIVILSFLYFQF